jgi:D-aminoacyl-tRNA deacylase
MRAVVQRADGARVVIDAQVVAEFQGPGLVALVGVTHTDTDDHARRLATKIYDLRIFEPRHSREPLDDARRELSASELDLPVIVVSQFTLYGDARKGRRPTWTAAAPGPVAAPLVDEVVRELRTRGATVGTGVFGADMRVELTNDGPITLVLDID